MLFTTCYTNRLCTFFYENNRYRVSNNISSLNTIHYCMQIKLGDLTKSRSLPNEIKSIESTRLYTVQCGAQ